VNPWKASDLSATRRNLPHLETAGATYFVTFRCRPGLEMPPEARAAVLSATQHWDGKRIALDAAVVMPDHAHAMFRITDGSRLGEVLHSIKSFSANQINTLLNRTGAFWLDETFDHVVRHAEEWEEKFEYIRQNPVKKGLADVPDAYPFLYPRNHRLEACATVEFEVFEPEAEKDVPGGTVTRAKATCLCCGAVLPPDRVRAQLAAQRGGADVIFDPSPSGRGQGEGLGRHTGGARMLAVVTLRPGEQGRHYRLPTEGDYEAVRKAQERLAAILGEWEVAQASSLRNTGKMPVPQQGLCPVPDEPLPPIGTLGFRVQRYGMFHWGDLFTARQKVALLHIGLAIKRCGAPDLQELLGLVFDGVVDRNAVLARWRPQADQEKVENVFARQALPMVWDFAEAVPTSESTGSLGDRVEATSGTTEVFARWVGVGDSLRAGQVQLADAVEHPLPNESAGAWFSDPPYYDAVPYADLSDFFFVWLKRGLPAHRLLVDPFDSTNPLTPKRREAVQDETKRDNGRPKDRTWFEERMADAFAEGRRVLREDGVGSVVFAHKTTEGWEALLTGMIRGGWTITGSWPIATEMATRLRARESAALATSVHLICRPRRDDAGVGDWADVLRELPNRVGDWMERLQGEGVRGADLVFACIGPALEIFSRYARVETAEGREVALAEYLEKVWEVVGREALAQVLGTAEAKARNGAAGAVEEDARLTALFLWTLQSTEGEGDSERPHPRPLSQGERGESGRPHPGPLPEGEGEETEDEDDEGGSARGKAKGFTLVFDVVRRFAQPLGIELPKWEGRVIETQKGVVRLLPIAERARQLFGEDGATAAAERLEADPTGGLQFALPGLEQGEAVRVRRRGGRGRPHPGPLPAGEGAMAVAATTLDRVHAAMLLQAGGRTNGLRALLKGEQERGPDFLRLANALSALYPKGSEEKRLLDAMLLAVPR
jgi:REP element-mobilizing transposase RayT